MLPPVDKPFILFLLVLLILPKSQRNTSRILRKNTTLLTSNQKIIAKGRVSKF